jgi:hypothetical protein
MNAWRGRGLVREAALNLRAAWVRTLLLVAVLAAATGALGFLELRQAAEARDFQESYAAAGAYVAIATSQGVPLDAGRCAALNVVPGVVAAGGVRAGGTLSFTSAPGVLFQSADVSGRVVAVWAPGAAVPPPGSGASALAGIALAEELGVLAGSFLQVEGREVAAVRAVIDAEPRNPRVQRWLLSETPPTGPVDECWVEFERSRFEAGIAALPAWFATGNDDPVVRPYLRADEFTRDVGEEFRARPQQWGWAAMALLAGVVSLLVAWFRRAELGLYLAVGTSRLQLLTMLACESAATVSAGFVAGLGGAFYAHAITGAAIPMDHAFIALATTGAGAVLAFVVAPIASLAAARGNVAAMLKER